MDTIGVVFEKKSRLDKEEMLVFQEANLHNYPIRYACVKHLLRKQNTPKVNEVPVGNIRFVHAACKSIGIDLPSVDYYPRILTPWLYRKVWKSSIKQVIRHFENGGEPIFIKPVKLKKFTGLVVSSETEIQQLQCSKNLDLWCSEVVKWLSEYRVYVVNRKIVHIGWYDGDDMVTLNVSDVNDALQVMWNANYPLSNFCIDFGILSSGQTALIEMGDGYSMGAYGISSRDYFNLIQGWWNDVNNNYYIDNLL